MKPALLCSQDYCNISSIALFEYGEAQSPTLLEFSNNCLHVGCLRLRLLLVQAKALGAVCMRRITMILMVAVVMLVAVAVPVMAQGVDKAARKAEKQAQKAEKQAQKAEKQAPKTDSAPKKATPETGGFSLGSVALLGGGALLVGGGLITLRATRR
jgi:Sec-independent protein translocase protein TatA